MHTEPEAAEKPSITLSLKGEGLTVNTKLTKAVALAVINVAYGGAPNAPALPRTDTAGQSAPGGGTGTDEQVTAGEYIESVNAGSNPEKITAFGVFLRDTRGQENFTREDIRGAFRAAHEPAPANFGRDFRTALSNRWVASDGENSDNYFVTSSGKKVVADHFTAPRTRRTRRKATRASSGGDDD